MAPASPSPDGKLSLLPKPLGPMAWLPVNAVLLNVRLQPMANKAPPWAIAPAPPVATLLLNEQLLMVAVVPASTSMAPATPKSCPVAPTAWLPVNVLLDTVNSEPVNQLEIAPPWLPSVALELSPPVAWLPVKVQFVIVALARLRR